jgi:hypothetical protein
MKHSRFAIAFLLIALGLLHVDLTQAQLGLSPVKVTATRKRTDVEVKNKSAHLVKKEDWIQVVTLENSSSKPLENIEAVYRIYKIDDSHGAERKDMKLKWTEGKKSFPLLERLKKEVFETEPITLETNTLKGGYYYTDGSKSQVRDKVRGFRIKVFENGKLIHDYANPTTLKTSDPWE